MLQGHGPFPWSHRESNSDLIFRRDLFYPLNYETPLHTIHYAKILPTSAKELVLICRVQLYLMQRYNNLEKNRYIQSINLKFPTEVQNGILKM